MIPAGLLLLLAAGFLTWVLRDVSMRSVAGPVMALVIMGLAIMGIHLVQSGVKLWRGHGGR
jgi:hypothetical protein